jgi:hypothetical protein
MEPTSGTAPTLCAVAIFVALVGASCGGDDAGDSTPDEARPPSPGVSFVDYSPRPLYTYMPQMKVRFTTTGPAGPGRHYVASLSMTDHTRDTDCKRELSAAGVDAGRPRTYRVSLGSQELPSESRLCAGAAQVIVRAQKIGDAAEGSVMQKLSLRVLPAHPRGKYSPQDRATQMAAEWYRWQGKDPPRGLTCTYMGADRSTFQWFSCGADAISVICTPKTTGQPLTGTSNRAHVTWGDCHLD